jgi:hypothetical protein
VVNVLAKTLPAAVADGVAPNRVKSAKELRRIYVQIMRSPDGTEPLPLTLPKCVECSHCGWPVDPRQSRVATRKTYLRAGIERGPREPRQSITQADGEGGEGEDAESGDSRDTQERLMDQVDTLIEENAELKRRVEDLENENADLKTEVESLKEGLEHAEEKVDMLETAELRWRQKLTTAKGEIERLKQSLERSGMVSADRETGLVATIQELQRVTQEYKAFRRRRDYMLDRVGEDYLRSGQREELLAQCLRLWRPVAVQLRCNRELEELEMRRQREVNELQQQLGVELVRRRALEANGVRLEGRLKAAAHRLLQRSLQSHSFPSAESNWFRAWVALTPLLAKETELEICQEDLEETQKKLENKISECNGFEDNLGKIQSELEAEQEERRKADEEVEFLRGLNKGNSREAAEEKARLEREKEARWVARLAEADQKLVDAQATWDEERNELECEIKVLEGKLLLAESMGGDGGGGGAPQIDEAACVVPRGQGVLCVGCLKQLVHRTVKPLSPRSAMRASPERLEAARRRFFEEELKGAASGDDAVHSYVFEARKDPYTVSRLSFLPKTHTVAPMPMDRSPSCPGFASTATGASFASTATATGLPALKRERTLAGFSGGATPLRRVMAEYRPKGFGSSATR